MVEKRVSVRLAAVGGRELKAELNSVGREGRAAMQAIGTGSVQASAGLGEVGSSAGGAVVALENLSARAARAATSLRAAGAAGSDAFAAGSVAARINQITGVTVATGQSTAEVIQHGHALDAMRAKYNPLFGVLRRYLSVRSEIRQAQRVGAITTDEMTAAMQRERQAALQSVAALKGRSVAMHNMARSGGMAAQRMQGLFFQANDVGVSLAGGMNPALVAAQQGSQVAQLYAFGGGGVKGLMADLGRMIKAPIARFPLLTAAVVGTGVALAGMTHEIREATGVAVTMGDTTKAVFEVIGRAVNEQLRPVIEAIAPWFAQTWDNVVVATKDLGNSVISIFVGTYNFITSLFSGLPGFISGMGKKAVNDLLGDLREPWLSINGHTIIPGLPIPEDAGFSLNEQEHAAVGSFGDAVNRDFMGGFFDSVKVETVNNALARTATAAGEAGSAGRAAGKALAEGADEAESGWDKTLKSLKDYAAGAMDLAGGIGDSIVGAFRGAENAVVQFVKTGKLSFSGMVTSLIADLARLAVRRFILGPIADALGGIFSGVGGSNIMTSLGPRTATYTPGAGWMSMEGGGHTGYGPRTGGLDGKGGFLAMMHPQERIIDETRGGRGGRHEAAPVYVTIQARDVESFRQSRTQIAADIGRAVALGRRGL